RSTMERSSATRESWPRNCSMPEISTARRTARPRSLSGTSTTTTTAGTAAQGAGHQHLESGRVSLTSSPHTPRGNLEVAFDVASHPFDRTSKGATHPPGVSRSNRKGALKSSSRAPHASVEPPNQPVRWFHCPRNELALHWSLCRRCG